MVEYGAVLEKAEIETLADYLAQHLGKTLAHHDRDVALRRPAHLDLRDFLA